MKRLAVLVVIIALAAGGYYYLKGAPAPVEGQTGGPVPAAAAKAPYEVKFTEGDFKGALIGIQKHLEQVKSAEEPYLYFMAAKSALETNRSEEAETYASIIIERFSGSIEGQENALALGKVFHARFVAVDKPNKDYWVTTRDLLGIGLNSRPVNADEIERQIDAINKVVEFSSEFVKGNVRYTVKRGDTMAKIADQYKTTSGMICRLNDIDNPNLIHEGQTFKVVPGGEFTITVEKGRFRLTVYRNNIYLKAYTVGIGKEGEETPTGTTTIKTKQIHPPWQPPGKPAVHYGQPDYPLGERWMGFDPKNFAHYGIHGTDENDSVGKKSSNGCVRLRNPAVEELFDIVTMGTAVTIKE